MLSFEWDDMMTVLLYTEARMPPSKSFHLTHSSRGLWFNAEGRAKRWWALTMNARERERERESDSFFLSYQSPCTQCRRRFPQWAVVAQPARVPASCRKRVGLARGSDRSACLELPSFRASARAAKAWRVWWPKTTTTLRPLAPCSSEYQENKHPRRGQTHHAIFARISSSWAQETDHQTCKGLSWLQQLDWWSTRD